MKGHIGFTGSSHGMLPQQLEGLRTWLRTVPIGIRWAHHGDCIGGDSQFHDAVAGLLPSCLIFIHPPVEPKARAHRMGEIIWHPRPYLQRNRELVDCIEVLLAAPKRRIESLRSGTWSTIRYAKSRGVPIVLFLPALAGVP